MNTRDQFATAALTGLIMHGPGKDMPVEMRGPDALVRFAYEIADEMVRQQKPEAENFEIFELACAASDAFVVAKTNLEAIEELHVLMDRLEEATRPRAMRKVRL